MPLTQVALATLVSKVVMAMSSFRDSVLQQDSCPGTICGAQAGLELVTPLSLPPEC